MTTRMANHLIRDGDLIAEVTVNLSSDDEPWGPTLSQADAYRIDDVRRAMQQKDYAAASTLARLYRLTPVRSTDLAGT